MKNSHLLKIVKLKFMIIFIGFEIKIGFSERFFDRCNYLFGIFKNKQK